MWLWYRPVVVIPIQPLAWELPYAAGGALKRPKKKKKKKREFEFHAKTNYAFLKAQIISKKLIKNII